MMIASAVVPGRRSCAAAAGRRPQLPLLSGQQPPVGRLPAVTQLELDPAVDHPVELRQPERRTLAGEDADQLWGGKAIGAICQRPEHRLERLARVAPGE